MKIFSTAAMALAAPGMLIAAVPSQAAVTYQPAPSHVDAWHDHDGEDDDEDGNRWERRGHREWAGDRGERRGRYPGSQGYQGGYYGQQAYYDQPVYADTRVWRGNDGRYYCKKKNGTTGLIIGGAAGALLGRSIAGRGNNTLGTILGAAGGALLGREVARSGSRCR